AEEATPKKDKYTIGFAAKSFQDPFTSWQAQTVKKFAKESYPNFDLKLLDSEMSVEKQTNLVENFISQKVDLIIVQPLDAQALIPAIDKAYALRPPIPVINLALKIDDKHSVSLESDPVLEGRLIGDYAAKHLPKDAKVAILQGEPGNLAAASRQKGIMEGLKARPDIKVIADQTSNWRRDKAMAITEDWLQAHPQIDAILCHNDDSALGAIEALKAKGKAGKVMVLGVDGLPEALKAIEEGLMTGTVVQQVVDQARTTLEVADKLLKGEKVKRHIQIPGELVSKENKNVQKWIDIEKEAGLIK
ncbi:MAG TPA: sugar ABC transporter substrate-binding protein, partial [Terrimicrobiaceae bacterium]|nr:sugar ABC transporter substrate-binding protein [Terrimicrobiaceae bacterium]